MANTGFLSSSDLDFTAYKASLIAFMQSQALFKDYNFSGSNLNVLMDLLARNTYLNAMYLNMVGSESFLDTVQLRESAVSKCKELNYLPRSRVSSSALVNIQVIPTGTPTTITIPQFYNMSASSPNGTVIFSTTQGYVLTNNGGSYSVSNVAIAEGQIVTEFFVVNATASYVLSSANVDISSILVNVQNSNVDTTNVNWQFASDLYGLGSNSQVYFLQGSQTDQYEIVFGNDETGQAVVNGNIISVTYRDCLGTDGDGYTSFRPIANIDTWSNILITLAGNTGSFGGTEKETIESMQFNAPRAFASQNRAITDVDFATLIKNQFPSIHGIAVFGGEKLVQKQYGCTIIAIRPYGANVAPQSLKNAVVSYVQDKNVLTNTPIIVDPDYYWVQVNSTVAYDTSLTTFGTFDIQNLVQASINVFSNSAIIDFGATLRYSKFCAAIDNTDASIVSNETTLQMIKRIVPVIGTAQSFTFSFGNQIVPADTDDNDYGITSTNFNYTANGVSYQSNLYDIEGGVLQIVTTTNSGSLLALANVGTVNYATGNVIINNVIFDSFPGDYISVYAQLVNKDIQVSLNQILDIDAADCSINVITANN